MSLYNYSINKYKKTLLNMVFLIISLILMIVSNQVKELLLLSGKRCTLLRTEKRCILLEHRFSG